MQARGLRPGDWNFTTEIKKGVEDFYVYFDSILSSRKPADNINVHCKFTEVNLSTTVLLKYSMPIPYAEASRDYVCNTYADRG